jgi:RNA polymerase-associated protein RTF1
MLEKRRAIEGDGTSGAGMPTASLALTMERARLTQARTLALRRQDAVEVAELDVQLAALPGGTKSSSGAGANAATDALLAEDVRDRLARVNERNRRANLEAVRRAEMVEAERKRARRKLEAAEGATPGSTRSAPCYVLQSIYYLLTCLLSGQARR